MVDKVLYIYKSLGTKGKGKLFGAVAYDLKELVCKIIWRIDRNGVSGMYSGPLYMLHYSRYEYVLSVRNNIDLKLRTFHVFIHQHRVIYSPGKYGIHVLDSMFIVMGYGHILSAYDIART